MRRTALVRRLVLVLLTAPAPVLAQAHGPSTHGAEPISASRPGLAESTETVGARVLQVEGGYSLTRVAGESSHSIGELLVRYGLGGRGELRVGLNSYAVQADHGVQTSGLEDASVGLKARVLDGHGVVPSVSVLAATTLPTGAHGIGSEATQPTGVLSLGWSLGERFALTTAGQYTRAGEPGHRVGELTAATSVGVALSHHLHAHAEYARIAETGHLSDGLHHVSGGFGYHLTGDFQLDLWSGYASHHGEGEVLFGFGLARRW